MFTQVELFLLLRAHWPLESAGFVLARAVRVFLLLHRALRPAAGSLWRRLFPVVLLILFIFVGLLSRVAGSLLLIRFCVPLALLIMTGETLRSLFRVLAGRRLLQFRFSDQVFAS
jgi:hypothetical protein